MGKTISEHMLDEEAMRKALDELREDENKPKSMPLSHEEKQFNYLWDSIRDIEKRLTALETTAEDNDD